MTEGLWKWPGWQKDAYDPRDFLVKATLKDIPDAYAMPSWLPTVRNQGDVGSCYGFALAANLAGRENRWGSFVEPYSPTWIYNGARFLAGTLMFDVGTRPRDALHWCYTKGCLLEHLWPYDPMKLDTTPPPSHLEFEAAKHPLLSYWRVVDGVTGICEVIADQYFVTLGTPWFEKWMNPKNGRLEKASMTDNIAGGHGTTLYGYDKNDRVFYGINSWGAEWGDHGLFTMPFSAFDVFKARGGYDAHCIGLTAAPEPDEENGGSVCKVARAAAWPLNVAAGALGRSWRLQPVRIK